MESNYTAWRDGAIRPERIDDAPAIGALTRLAFLGAIHSSGTEHLIVAGLRSHGALTLSLVAEWKGEIVGHVAFSPVAVSDGSEGWQGLGPVSVSPAMQGKGIGTCLIEHGLAELKAAGTKGCVVLGEPEFYGRFGFVHRPACVLVGVPPEYLMCLPFRGTFPHGTVTYHAAFETALPE